MNPSWIEITCFLLDIAGNVSGNCYTKIDQIYPMLGWETAAVRENMLNPRILNVDGAVIIASVITASVSLFSGIDHQLVEGPTLI